MDHLEVCRLGGSALATTTSAYCGIANLQGPSATACRPENMVMNHDCPTTDEMSLAPHIHLLHSHYGSRQSIDAEGGLMGSLEDEDFSG